MINKNELIWENEFLKVFFIEQKPKTKRYSVWNKSCDTKLGEIEWYPAWRKYCFIIGDLVFDNKCLSSLSDVLILENDKHRKKKGEENDKR